MPIQPFDLGKVIMQAEAIKGMRRQGEEDVIRKRYLEGQVAGQDQAQQIAGAAEDRAVTQFSQEQQIQNTRMLHVAAKAVAADPAHAQQWLPQLVKAGVIAPDFDPSKVPPEQLQAAAAQVAQQTEMVLQTYIQQNPQFAQMDRAHQLQLEEMAAQHQNRLGEITATGAESRKTALTRSDPRQIITRPVADGMVQDFLVDSRTGARTPNGEPYSAADAKGPSGLGSRESVMFQRVMNSANSAATALKNISELPVGASTGVLGIGSGPGHSIFQSTKSTMLNKLSSQDVQDYNTMLAGVSRNLSTIETAGLAPNGSITASMDSIQLREGDTEITKLRKLAEMRQIIEKGIEPNLANPKLPPEQKQLVRNIVKQVAESIPFTQHDVTELQRRQQKNPAFTLQDLIRKQGLATPETPNDPSTAPTATGPDGERVILKNGQWVPLDG